MDLALSIPLAEAADDCWSTWEDDTMRYHVCHEVRSVLMDSMHSNSVCDDQFKRLSCAEGKAQEKIHEQSEKKMLQERIHEWSNGDEEHQVVRDRDCRARRRLSSVVLQEKPSVSVQQASPGTAHRGPVARWQPKNRRFSP